MHKFLLTTALVIPFSLGTALAQDTAAPAADTPETAPAATVDATTPVTPAETAPVTPAETATPVDDAAAPADALASEMATSDKVVHEQTATELRLDWITGASVHAPDGEKVGDISDLILDGNSGQMSAAIIGVGGFLGIGQKQIAVPWDRLTINYDAREITSDLTRDEANAAPEYVFRAQDAAPASADAPAQPTDPAVTTPPTVDPVADPATPPAVDPAVTPTTEPAVIDPTAGADPDMDPVTGTPPEPLPTDGVDVAPSAETPEGETAPTN